VAAARGLANRGGKRKKSENANDESKGRSLKNKTKKTRKRLCSLVVDEAHLGFIYKLSLLRVGAFCLPKLMMILLRVKTGRILN
jgi:hypothetical protein